MSLLSGLGVWKQWAHCAGSWQRVEEGGRAVGGGGGGLKRREDRRGKLAKWCMREDELKGEISVVSQSIKNPGVL